MSQQPVEAKDDPALEALEASLQRTVETLRVNLEFQEMTLMVQMDLQVELLGHMRLQEQMQADIERLERERLTLGRLQMASTVDESLPSKMSSILEVKQRLRYELTEHLGMQHGLLSQLNQSVRPPAGGFRAVLRGATDPVPNQDGSGPANTEWETASTNQA